MTKRFSLELVRVYGLTASSLTIFQSILWVILSLLAILCYEDVIKLTADEFYIGYYIYNIFFHNTYTNLPSHIIKPDEFFIINSYYLFVSLIWFGISLYFFIMFIKSKWNIAKYSIISWISITTVTLLSDLIICGLLIYDFNSMISHRSINIDLSYVVILFVTGKGFVFWILNLVFVIFFAKLTITDYLQRSKVVFKPRQSYNARAEPSEARNEGNIEHNPRMINDDISMSERLNGRMNGDVTRNERINDNPYRSEWENEPIDDNPSRSEWMNERINDNPSRSEWVNERINDKPYRSEWVNDRINDKPSRNDWDNERINGNPSRNPMRNEPRKEFSPSLIDALEDSYSLPKLPRLPYIQQSLLRPRTPPIDYSPIHMRKPIRSVSQYEPLKY